MGALAPVDPELWSQNGAPHLMGGRLPSGEIVFPMPQGDAAEGVEPIKLSRHGKLWSWTSQGFLPKEPYEGWGSGENEGPPDFKPFLLGYIELPGEVIVESRIVDATLDDLKLGMPMEFCLTPFSDTQSTFAYRPFESSENAS